MRRALAVLALLLAGCAPTVSLGGGHGVALGSHRVLTVEHVAVAGGYEILERWPRAGEDLVVVEVVAPLPLAAILRRLRLGDSGLPLVNRRGEVLGLVSRVRGDGTILVTPVRLEDK